jgi:replicative DNA helicase
MEKNGNRKPRLSDLRESGSIEQDADVVGLLYKPTQEEEGDVPSSVLPVNLLIAKQRNGPTGEVELAFLKHFTRFESAARTNESSSPHND